MHEELPRSRSRLRGWHLVLLALVTAAVWTPGSPFESPSHWSLILRLLTAACCAFALAWSLGIELRGAALAALAFSGSSAVLSQLDLDMAGLTRGASTRLDAFPFDLLPMGLVLVAWALAWHLRVQLAEDSTRGSAWRVAGFMGLLLAYALHWARGSGEAVSVLPPTHPARAAAWSATAAFVLALSAMLSPRTCGLRWGSAWTSVAAFGWLLAPHVEQPLVPLAASLAVAVLAGAALDRACGPARLAAALALGAMALSPSWSVSVERTQANPPSLDPPDELIEASVTRLAGFGRNGPSLTVRVDDRLPVESVRVRLEHANGAPASARPLPLQLQRGPAGAEVWTSPTLDLWSLAEGDYLLRVLLFDGRQELIGRRLVWSGAIQAPRRNVPLPMTLFLASLVLCVLMRTGAGNLAWALLWLAALVEIVWVSSGHAHLRLGTYLSIIGIPLTGWVASRGLDASAVKDRAATSA